jgi:hypothetical protein
MAASNHKGIGFLIPPRNHTSDGLGSIEDTCMLLIAISRQAINIAA